MSSLIFAVKTACYIPPMSTNRTLIALALLGVLRVR